MAKSAPRTIAPTAPPAKPKKLTFKEQQELTGLPARIERLDAEHAELLARMASPGFYQQKASDITGVTSRLAAITAELASLYARWEALEQRKG